MRLKRLWPFKAFFFCISVSAQSLYFEKPVSGEPLDDIQEFVIAVLGGEPSRVDFYLNGRLVLARKRPPYRFEVRWNTRQKNSVKVVALFPEKGPLVLEREFREMRTDLQETVEAFQCFPFLDRPLAERWQFLSAGKPIPPQSFEPADKLSLSLVIVLDISGSMKHALSGLSPSFATFWHHIREKSRDSRFLVFDSRPRLLANDLVPDNLEHLYAGEPKSVIWDALATATELFEATPRRVVLLISDGADDGSSHDPDSVATYFRRTEASLIWLNPTTHANRRLTRLALRSGGFRFFGDGPDPWPRLTNRIDHQYHLLAPDASFPIELSLSSGKAWYPKWME